MSRGFPVYTRQQLCIEEQYERDRTLLLKSNNRLDDGDDDGHGISKKLSTSLKNGIPIINPGEVAIRLREEEREMQRQARAAAKQHLNRISEARNNDSRQLLETLGRSKYLEERYKHAPSERYNLPLTSSWQYGWNNKIGGEDDSSRDDSSPQRAFESKRHGRMACLRDTFYTTNGISTLS